MEQIRPSAGHSIGSDQFGGMHLLLTGRLFGVKRKWGYGVDRGRSKDDGWRPVLVINDVSDEHLEENCQRIREWIQRHKIAIVNIAGTLLPFTLTTRSSLQTIFQGHRETTSGMGPLFAAQVTKILGHALADLV